MEGFQVLKWPIPWVLAYFCIMVASWSLLGRIYPVLRFLCKYRSQRSLISRCGKGSWAVVTGASYGIGLGFAKVLAAKGFNIVLIARSGEILRKIAAELETKHGILTRVIVFDFSHAGSDYEGFYESLVRQLNDLDVSFLVNNVGWGTDILYEKQELEAITKLLELDVWPQLFLSRWGLSRMEKRLSQSVILSLSSLACVFPLAACALYSAVKEYDDFLSRALSNEKSLHNVHLLSLRPGFVDTPLAANSRDKFLEISIEECAEAVLEHVSTASYTSGHWKNRLMRFIFFFIPESLWATMSLKKYKV